MTQQEAIDRLIEICRLKSWNATGNAIAEEGYPGDGVDYVAMLAEWEDYVAILAKWEETNIL